MSPPPPLFHVALMLDVIARYPYENNWYWVAVYLRDRYNKPPIEFLRSRGSNRYLNLQDIMDTPMTRSLLDYGANPNTIFRSGPYRLTPLQMVLGYLEDQDTVAHVGLVGRPIPKEVIANCVSTLLKAGADVNYVWTEKDENNPIFQSLSTCTTCLIPA
jgi:hypothetical protein